MGEQGVNKALLSLHSGYSYLQTTIKNKGEK